MRYLVLVLAELVDEVGGVLAAGRRRLVDTVAHLLQLGLARLVALHAVVVDPLTLGAQLLAKRNHRATGVKQYKIPSYNNNNNNTTWGINK